MVYIWVVFLFVSCSSIDTEVESNSKFEMFVPEKFLNNSEITAFIKSNEQLLNIWADDFNALLLAYEPFLYKTQDQLNVIDKLKLEKLSIELASMLSEFGADAAAMQQDLLFIEDGLTEKEQEVFLLVESQMTMRIQEIKDMHGPIVNYSYELKFPQKQH